MPNNHMDFSVDLIPSTNNTYNLGSSDKKWVINGISDPKFTDTTYTAGTGLSLSGTQFNLKDNYGTCSTAANESAKTVSDISNFTLTDGVSVHITFTYANTTNTPTLNIGGTGAKTIALVNGNITPWNAGETICFTYTNNQWLINDYGKVEVIRL